MQTDTPSANLILTNGQLSSSVHLGMSLLCHVWVVCVLDRPALAQRVTGGDLLVGYCLLVRAHYGALKFLLTSRYVGEVKSGVKYFAIYGLKPGYTGEKIGFLL